MSAADRVITRLTLCERTAKRAGGRSEPADRRRLDLTEFDVLDSARRSMPLPAVTSSAVSGRLASRLMRSSPRNNLNFADRRAFLAGVPRRSGDALPGVAEVGDDLELAAEGTDVVSQRGELGD
jgi:hypothetical protein